jgi:hypothetical protein
MKTNRENTGSGKLFKTDPFFESLINLQKMGKPGGWKDKHPGTVETR